MGGVISSPIDAGTKREIEDAIKTTLGTFTKNYVKYYAIGMVNKIRDEAQSDDPGWKLLEREEPTDDRKVGYVEKEGGVFTKKMNPRYFIVRHDWMIDYYESEEHVKKEGAKPRNTLSLCGYRVNPDANDTIINRLKALAEKMGMNFEDFPKPKEYPPGTIELHHERRPSYYIRIEDEEERKKWVEVFRDCCRLAYGYKNKDAVHKFAFDEAVRKTRYASGAWGWYSWGGTEEQVLADLLADYIDWKIMGKIYSKIVGPWRVRYMIRNQILKILNKTVLAAVTPAWKAMNAAVQALVPKIEPKLKEGLAPLFKLQGEMVDKMKNGAMSIIDPVLKEHVAPHLEKIVACIKSPMVEAFDVSYKLFDEEIGKFHFEGGKEEAKKAFHEFNHFANSWHMWNALDKVDTMYEPLWALRIVFDDISPWSLIWHARDVLRKKMDNAMFTFEERLVKALEDGENKDTKALVEKIKGEVLADYHADGKKATIKYYRKIIKEIVMPPFQSKVVPACEKIISPLADAVPDALTPLCDVNQMFEDLLNGIIDDSIDSVLGGKDQD